MDEDRPLKKPKSSSVVSKTPPEQNHLIYPKLSKVLNTDDGALPGINCCAVCGGAEKDLHECSICERVAYCSTSCREQDISTHRRVCGILKSISDHGDVDYTGDIGDCDAMEHAPAVALGLARCATALDEGSSPESWDGMFGDDGGNGALIQARRLLTARFSYCCTLNWCIQNVPVLKALRKSLSSAKNVKSGASGDEKDESGDDGESGGGWVEVLVLGASAAECRVAPCEMWSLRRAGGQRGAGLRLTFVGPEVPAELHGTTVDASSTARSGGEVRRTALRHFRGTFESYLTFGVRLFASPKASAKKMKTKAVDYQHDSGALADAVFGFNLGLTCPDYTWSLSALGDMLEGVPLVLVTNTEGEMRMDLECLEHNHSVRLRKAVTAPNPFAWLAWRQSGTLANDVYRKNSFVAAGRIKAVSSSYAALAQEAAKKKKRKKKK